MEKKCKRSIKMEMKICELYLGALKVDWNYAKIRYTAVCTEALPLTFMEKIVCGIANLDDKVCLNDLAHIMGLNIEDDVQNLKFQDKGETEILTETLRTLKQFGMIATSDDSFSHIWLTDIGKEHYTQGRKFKQGETKYFTMYYDLMAGKHSRAKDLFVNLSTDGSKEEQECMEIPYKDEKFVKKYAESQIPQYYSKKTGNSFTDMSVKSKSFLYKEVELGVVYNASTKTYHFVVKENGDIDTEYISDYVNSEACLTHYLESFFVGQPITSASKEDAQIKFEEEISKVQSEAEYANYNKETEQATQIVKDYLRSPKYMEKENLFNFIRLKHIEGNIHEVFINLPELTNDAEKEIRKISKDGNMRIFLSCGDIEDFDSRFNKNVLSLNEENDSEVCLVMEDATYRCDNMVFTFKNANFNFKFLHKQKTNSKEELEQIRKRYATRFIPKALDEYEELLQDESSANITDRLEELKDADKIIMFTDSHVLSTGNGERLDTLRACRDEQIQQLVRRYSIDLTGELERIQANAPLESIATLNDMEKAKESFYDFKKKLIPEQSIDKENIYGQSEEVLALHNSISSFESLLKEREIYLHRELSQKDYIIDTNVFVLLPKIMDFISPNDRVILSAKVLEELDKLKVTLDGKGRNNVREAIKEINGKIRMKSKTLRLECADSSLLPEDFDKRNPDNMILSVALKYKKGNPILITQDMNFQNRAASAGIPFKGLKDLLPGDVYQAIDVTRPETRRESGSEIKISQNTSRVLPPILREAYKICMEESDEVLVAKLISKVKTIQPDFKVKHLGYPKFKDFCAAHPTEIRLYENSKNALCIRLIGDNNKNNKTL